MKGRLISVNNIPHVYSDTLAHAFELSIQDRAELNPEWLGAECMFNVELNYAKVIPNSIVPASINADAWHIMSLLNDEELNSEQKIEAAKDFIFNNF
jgi:hypothetical protein